MVVVTKATKMLVAISVVANAVVGAGSSSNSVAFGSNNICGGSNRQYLAGQEV